MVHAVRPFACPNQGFMRQLMVRLHACQRRRPSVTPLFRHRLTRFARQAFEEAEAMQRGGRVYQTRAASRLAGVAPC